MVESRLALAIMTREVSVSLSSMKTRAPYEAYFLVKPGRTSSVLIGQYSFAHLGTVVVACRLYTPEDQKAGRQLAAELTQHQCADLKLCES